jgi:23S rRNA G2445 N2-methylase RlmL
MMSAHDLNLAKKIKRLIYGKPNTIKLAFPNGFSKAAWAECTEILANLWLSQKYVSTMELHENEIIVRNIHFSAINELLLRGLCFTDVRLVIAIKKISSNYAFEQYVKTLPWEYYLSANMVLKIKIKSIASRAFHETGLTQLLACTVMSYVKEVVKGEQTDETTSLYCDLYKNKLTISISLAGKPLYKRGYRSAFSASAPLREDIAASCLKKIALFVKQFDETYQPSLVLVPFSGTGTFAFEQFIQQNHLSSIAFQREFALCDMPLFRAETFQFLVKKSLTYSSNLLRQTDSTHYVCIDHAAEANQAILSNETTLISKLQRCELPPIQSFIHYHTDDFLKMSLEQLITALDPKDILLPLNPPYGLRLMQHQDTTAFYGEIADKINELSARQTLLHKKLSGFILCPTEASWNECRKRLKCQQQDTYHFNQGGLDIRVLQFYMI